MTDDKDDAPTPAVAMPRTRSRELREARPHIMQFFAWSELAGHAAMIGRAYADLAENINANVSDNEERTEALRCLLDSREACLRASRAQDPLSATSGRWRSDGT